MTNDFSLNFKKVFNKFLNSFFYLTSINCLSYIGAENSVPMTSLKLETINSPIAGKTFLPLFLTQSAIKMKIRAIDIIGPYKITIRLRKSRLKDHKNQHTNALKKLSFVSQVSSFDYHQLVEFKNQVST